jgi:hypothetical protein
MIFAWERDAMQRRAPPLPNGNERISKHMSRNNDLDLD